MNYTRENDTRTKKSFITPAGAILVLLCFFLPWVKFSCAGAEETVSGMRLAQEEGLIWLVLIVALVILGVFFYMRSKKTLWKSRRYTLIGSAVALLVIMYEFIDFVTGVDTEFGRIKPGDVGFTLQFGFFGTLLGFIIAAVGAFMLPKGPPGPQAERLSETDAPAASSSVTGREMDDILSVLQRWLQSLKQWFQSFDWGTTGERVESALLPKEQPEAQNEGLPEMGVSAAEPIIISEEMADTASVLERRPQSLGQWLRSFDWRATSKRIGGYIMNSTKSSSFAQIITPVIKLAIGLVALLIIRYIVSVIPMIKDTEVTRMPVTPLQIVYAVINTIILIVLLNFGREFKKELQLTLPNFTEAGTAANLVIILIVICVAYTVYDGIVDALISSNYSWIYPVVLLCIALVPLYLLGVILYKNIDKFTGRIVGKFRVGAKEDNTCPNCGDSLTSDANFCPNCGQEIAKAEAELGSCPDCGAIIEGEFCKNCGAPLEQPSEEVSEAAEDTEE